MSEIINQEYEQVPIGAVQPHPKNPRVGDVDAISNSVETNGFYGALVVQRSTGYILAGNHRWMAAKQKGMEHVPVIYLDVDDGSALRILAVDNRTTDLGYDEPRKLAALLHTVQEEQGTLDGTGFDDEELRRLVRKIENQYTCPETEESLDELFVSDPDGELTGLSYNTRVVIGEFAFPVPCREYIRWLAEMRHEAGYSEDEIKEAIRKRLGIQIGEAC